MDQTSSAATSGQHGVHSSTETPTLETTTPSETNQIAANPAIGETPEARKRRRRGRRGGRGRRKNGEGQVEGVETAAAPQVTSEQPPPQEKKKASAPQQQSRAEAPRPDSRRNDRQRQDGDRHRNRVNGNGNGGGRSRDRDRHEKRNGHRRGSKLEDVRRPGDPVASSAIWAGWSAARFGSNETE